MVEWNYSVASTGAAGVGAKLSSTPTSKEPLPAKLPTKMQRTNKATAKNQVDFSRKLVVRWTPPIWLAPWNPVASPPPLGFWTKITAPKRKQTIKITTVRNTIMFSC